MSRELAKQIIRKFEGLRLVAYKDPVGIWTIGYGHTRGVRKGMQITLEEAELLLDQDVQHAMRLVQAFCEETEVQLNEQQTAALVSLAFNLGDKAFQPWTTLTLRVRNQDWATVPDAIRMWVYAKGKKLPGLVARREAEARVWSGLPPFEHHE